MYENSDDDGIFAVRSPGWHHIGNRESIAAFTRGTIGGWPVRGVRREEVKTGHPADVVIIGSVRSGSVEPCDGGGTIARRQ